MGKFFGVNKAGDFGEFSGPNFVKAQTVSKKRLKR